MERYQVVLDAIMCILWIVTYTLCFVSTIKYKYPTFSPIAQLFGASFEFSVLIKFILKGFRFNYAFATYVYWTAIEIGIIVLVIKYTFHYNRKQTIIYLMTCTAMTALMVYLVVVLNYAVVFSYIITFFAELFWLYYITKEKYPIKPLILAAFISKFVADICAIPVYFHYGHRIISVLAIVVPIIDFSFFVVYYLRKNEIKKASRTTSKKKKR